MANTRLTYLDRGNAWEQYAKLLCISVSSLRKLIKTGVLLPLPRESDGRIKLGDVEYVRDCFKKISVELLPSGKVRIVNLANPESHWSQRRYARAIGVSRQTLWNWINEKRIPPFPVDSNGKVVFDEVYLNMLMSITIPKGIKTGTGRTIGDTTRLMRSLRERQIEEVKKEIKKEKGKRII